MLEAACIFIAVHVCAGGVCAVLERVCGDACLFYSCTSYHKRLIASTFAVAVYVSVGQ